MVSTFKQRHFSQIDENLNEFVAKNIKKTENKLRTKLVELHEDAL